MDNINVVVEANNARKGYTQTYETIVLKPNVHDEVNVLTEEMFTKENAKYVIKWDYDLGGASITIPENCIISMEGGSLTNGTLVGQNTSLINESGDESLVSVGLRGSWKRPDAHVTADEEDLTINNHNQIQLANKVYDEEAFSGMGRVYLRKNIVDGKNILDETMMSEPNTIYVIQYDFDLDGETIEVPENCVLKFEGGSLSNGSVVGTVNVVGSVNDYSIFTGVIKKLLLASEIGMIPNNRSYRQNNVEKAVNVINKGYGIVFDNTYFLGSAINSGLTVTSDLYLEGGHIIMTNDEVFRISVLNNVTINNVHVSSETTAFDTKTWDFVYIPKGVNINIDNVTINNCIIDSVTVFCYRSNDVDQVTTKTYIKNLVFKNNVVTASCAFSLRVWDVYIDNAIIEGNVIKEVWGEAISFQRTNEYTAYSGYLVQNLIFTNNVVENANPVNINSDKYLCALLAETVNATVTNNYIKGICRLYTGADAIIPIAVYAFYVNSVKIIVSNNTLINNIDLQSNNYNELIKCKSSGTDKIIRNNACYIEKEFLDKYSIAQDAVSVRITQFQYAQKIDVIELCNNVINVACILNFGLQYSSFRMFTFNCNCIKCYKFEGTCLFAGAVASTSADGGYFYFKDNKIETDSITNDTAIFRPPHPYMHVEISNNRFPFRITSLRNEAFAYFVSYNNIINITDGVDLFTYGNYNDTVIYNSAIFNDYLSIKQDYNKTSKVVLNLTYSGNYLSFSNEKTTSCKFIYVTIKNETHVFCLAYNNSTYTGFVDTTPLSASGRFHTNNYQYSLRQSDGRILLQNLSFSNEKIKIVINSYESTNEINESFFDRSLNIPVSWNGTKWIEEDGATAGVRRSGTTVNRPAAADIYAGFQYFDTTLGAMITWNGSYWVNENGFHAAVVRGELADRPTSELTAVDEGYQYYATDVHKAVYFSYNNGSPKWYYADGTDVQ